MNAVPLALTGTLDVSRTPAVPFGRLVGVELRKMADTRAGRWLLTGTAVVTALVLAVQVTVGLVQDLPLDLRLFMMGVNAPMGVFLPVLGIMSVTSEWSQRTALVTFTQVPSRGRVVSAKLAAALGVALAAVVVGVVLAVAANAAFGLLSGTDGRWNVGAVEAGYYLLLHLFGLGLGFALGMLLLNTAAAVVVYFVVTFVLPGLSSLGAALLPWWRDLQPWVDFQFAQLPLVEGDPVGRDWAPLATSGLLWLALPFVVGLWRVLRADVK